MRTLNIRKGIIKIEHLKGKPIWISLIPLTGTVKREYRELTVEEARRAAAALIKAAAEMESEAK